jgi:hypothetical protein
MNTKEFKATDILTRAEDFIAHERGLNPHWASETQKLINLAITHLDKGLGVSIKELADFFSGDAYEILRVLNYGYSEKNKHDLSVLDLAKTHL